MGLFAEMVRDSYLEGSKDILDSIAPEIIRSKNPRAKLYLTLGYRDRAVGFNHYTIGTASNPKLHSYKIYKYIESVKMARRAKRYAFLALYESRTGEMKRKIFNHMFEMERESGSPFYNRFLAKNGDLFLNELNREYYDYTHEGTAAEKPADGAAETKSDREYGSFEKKTERRVRFRAEKTVAHLLLTEEFEKAEDTIREYVEDFNYKMIKATIEMLAAESGEPGGGLEYKKFLLHHTDNYVRFSKESALSSFSGTVKVEDSVEKEKPAGEKKLGNETAEHAKEEPAEAKNERPCRREYAHRPLSRPRTAQEWKIQKTFCTGFITGCSTRCRAAVTPAREMPPARSAKRTATSERPSPPSIWRWRRLTVPLLPWRSCPSTPPCWSI
ncbi:MAG: hypothetical protein EHM32_03780 [Spirochaetales bacterium]|nr:MAG: hypothetical protein EHM32_03780 [Spirochaetales bacterium]